MEVSLFSLPPSVPVPSFPTVAVVDAIADISASTNIPTDADILKAENQTEAFRFPAIFLSASPKLGTLELISVFDVTKKVYHSVVCTLESRPRDRVHYPHYQARALNKNSVSGCERTSRPLSHVPAPQ